jgi:hypothetical protein
MIKVNKSLRNIYKLKTKKNHKSPSWKDVLQDLMINKLCITNDERNMINSCIIRYDVSAHRNNVTDYSIYDQTTSLIPIILGARVAQWVRSLDLAAHTSLSPIRRGFAPSFVNYKKGCTRLAAASDKVYQLLAQGRWFSPGTSASSTTKTGRHDIAEILLKVALNTKIQIQIHAYQLLKERH